MPPLQLAERELWGTYDLLWGSFDDVRQALLDKAQSAWMAYRRFNCELLAERDGAIADEPLERCLEFMTRERAAELRFLTF